VLLVEDSPMNRKLAVGLLERWGHTVTVADNGLAAVSLMRDQSFDVVLMDVQMPEMDGLEATRFIRREEMAFRRSRTPIIAMTAHAMTGDRERCLAAGMDDYVMKPIRADLLFRALEDVPLSTAERGGIDAPGDSLIDLSAARAAVNDDPVLLSQVAEAFLDEGPALLEQLQSAFKRGEWKDARRLAHTLKGSLLTFGARTVAEAAQALESSAKAETPVSDAAALATFIEETQSVLAELRRYLNSPHKSGNMSGRDRAVRSPAS
jgi:CheY-like chemotaxis protein